MLPWDYPSLIACPDIAVGLWESSSPSQALLAFTQWDKDGKGVSEGCLPPAQCASAAAGPPVGVGVGTQAGPGSQGRMETVSNLSRLRDAERFYLLWFFTSVYVCVWRVYGFYLSLNLFMPTCSHDLQVIKKKNKTRKICHDVSSFVLTICDLSLFTSFLVIWYRYRYRYRLDVDIDLCHLC